MNLLQPLFSVIPRSRASGVLLVASMVVATLATTLVAAVPLYSDAIVEAGLRSTLADAAPAERGLESSFRTDASAWTATTAELDDLGPARLPGELDELTIARTDTYSLPDAAVERIDDAPPITSIATLTSGRQVLTTVEGPVAVGDPSAVGAALHVDAAAALGLAPGDSIELARQGGDPLTVVVVELVEPADRLDEIWFDQPVVRDGLATNGSFTEVGPFLVDPADFARLPGTANYLWRVLIEPDSVRTDDLQRLRRGAAGMETALGDRLGVGNLEVATELPGLLAATDTAIGSTAAVVAAILLQLVGVALYGVGLSASVLVSSRAVETSMLRSRGATPQQLAAMAATEAVLIAVPAVVLGPWLGGRVVEAVERWGPVAITGLDLRPEASSAALIASMVVGLIVVGIVTWPAVRSARGFAASQAARARSEGLLGLQRTGLDLGVVAIAVLGLWQLSGSSAATSDLAGRLGTDPVLVLAPALGVVATSFLTLRMIGLVAGASERVTTIQPRLPLAMAGWELARRPGRTARTAVLVVLSVTVGTFAAVHGASWQRSQRDQADASVSADAVVTPDLRPAAAIAPPLLPSAYASLGLGRAVPVDTGTATLSSTLGTVPVVATDAVALGDLLRLRGDLYGELGTPDRFAELRSPVDLGGVPIGEPTDDLRIAYELAGDPAGATGRIGLAATLLDGNGTPVRVGIESIPIDEPAGEIVVPLRSTVGPGLDLALTGPLELLELQVDVPSVQDSPFNEEPLPHAVLVLDLLAAEIGDRAVPLSGSWEIGATALGSPLEPGSASVVGVGDGLRISIDSGLTQQAGAAYRAEVATGRFGTGDGAEVPAYVTPELLDAIQLDVGDTLRGRLAGGSVDLRILGVVPVVPFAVDEPLAILVDWPTLSADRWSRGRRIDAVTQWALSVDADDAESLERALSGPPFESVDVTERRQLAREIARAPVTVGLSGSLTLALAASLAVAAIGLILTAVVGARERRPAFAVLRAMGARAAELRRWLLLETLPLVGLSAAAGLVSGIVLARLALRSLGVAEDGTPAVPEPALVVPWGVLAVITAIAVAAGMALPVVTARLLRRHRTADELRIGDTT